MHFAHMEINDGAEDLHKSPFERRRPAPEARNLWPLTMDGTPTAFKTLAVPASTNIVNVVARADDSDKPTSTCEPGNNSGACQKPVSAESTALPMILGIVLPIVGALIALVILHRRHVNKQKREDMNDRHASLDFGLGEQQNKWKKQRGDGQNMGGAETQEKKGNHKKHGMSFDMMSPYILPAALNQSQDSLHSLSRNIHNHEDPYRPVTAMGDNGSIRSFGGNQRKHDGSSIHTGYTQNSNIDNPNAGLTANASQMGKSPVNSSFPLPPRNGSMPRDNSPTNLSPIEPAYFPSGPSLDDRDESRSGNSLMPGNAQDGRESYMGQDTAALRLSNNYLGSYIAGGDGPKSPPPSAPKIEQESPFSDQAAIKMPEEPQPAATKSTTPPPTFMMPEEPLPSRQASLPQSPPAASHPPVPTIAEPQEWKEDKYEDNDAFYVTPPSPPREVVDKRASRYSMDVPPEEYTKAGLGAPGVDARRISMGFRPLPPMLAVESDDPEVRANRIRSFYKEYFDDSKPAPQGQYYEDYDDGNYYDQNQPAQPYAEPMPRRAMTPPPQAQRYMGQHPPRALHGSLSQENHGPPQPRGYNGPPFPRGTPTGTPRHSNGSEWRGPPGFGEPRPYSSASNRSRGTQQSRRAPLPPPADLSTIPTPALLKDDQFAIINATDFAPPTTYAERTRGRSQSPMGERRAYAPRVPAAKQLTSAFDELAVIPSPHLLRKSGTFTSLDFAPPKRIRDDGGSGSDAGSIRSMRSGISNMGLQAIRAGANRVSKIPQDQVFTRDDMSTVLKPTWDQRK